MKHYLIIFALLLAGQGWGQVDLPKPREVDKDYRKDYRREIREYNQIEKRLNEENWDVTIPIEETVPTDVISAEEFRAMEYSNWYRDLIAPGRLAGDMLRAAKRKGVVDVTDTGCDTDHQDLQVGKIPGSNYTADPCPDVHGHSTHVTGIIYLILKPLIENGWIKYKMAKFLGDKGQGAYGAIEGGVLEETDFLKDEFLSYGQFAVANGSWGGGTSVYQPLADALKKSKDAGVVWFFAAGNSGGPVIFPGLLPEVSAVGSLDKDLSRSSFSCFGPELDFVAGGRDIYSTLPGGKYGSFSGTSMATPAETASGAAAMCFYPSLTAETLPGYLAEISKDLGPGGFDDEYGYGMAFIRAILDNPPDSEEPEPDPPTCEDGIQNGNETGIDCGGDCPPCEPEGPPEYRKRKFELALEGSWNLGWWQTLPAGLDSPQMYDLDATALISPAGLTQINIRRMVYDVNSESTFEWETDALKANAAEFFHNRALGTQAGWDIRDAGRWVLYFLDYFAANQADGYIYQDIEPKEVVFDWEGYRVEIREGLISYKPKK